MYAEFQNDDSALARLSDSSDTIEAYAILLGPLPNPVQVIYVQTMASYLDHQLLLGSERMHVMRISQTSNTVPCWMGFLLWTYNIDG